MTGYTFIHKHSFFDLTLPKPVVEVCNMLQLGEAGKFHFLEPSLASDGNEMRIKSRLVVKKLPDGSWNLTNTGSSTIDNEDDEMPTKNVYIMCQTENAENIDPQLERQEDQQPQAPFPATVEAETQQPQADVDVPTVVKVEIPVSADVITDVPAEVSAEVSTTVKVETSVPTEAPVVLEILASHDDCEKDEESGLQDHNYTGGDCEEQDNTMDYDDDDYAIPEIISKVGIKSINENEIIVVKPENDKTTQRQSDKKSLTDIINKAYKCHGNKSRGRMSIEQRSQGGLRCPICGAYSKDAFNLMKHLKRLHANHDQFTEELEKMKPLMQQTCDVCGQVLLNRKTLNEHKQNIHQNFMGIQCPHCKKKYKTHNHLRMHVKYVHLRKDKSFACDKCPTRFDSKKILETHILYHHTNMERIYRCELCDYRYAFPKQYYEHRTRVHGPKKEICPHCGYKCATKWYMNKHIVGCNKNRLKNMPRKRIIVDVSQGVRAGDVVVDDTHHAQNDTSFAPSDVTDALVQIENRELVQTDISEPVVEMPTMWELQPESETVDAVVQGDMVEENMIIVEQQDASQQFAITGPDGTQHIIQLVFPE